MFKPTIAAAVGLSAMLTAAQADTIIIQSQPDGPPLIEVLPSTADVLGARPHVIAPGTPDADSVPFAAPAFGRMLEMCDRMGVDCETAFAGLQGDTDLPNPLWAPENLSPEALADAEKLYALMAEEWAEAAAERAEQAHRLPTPNLFGWSTPPVWPHVAPRTWPDVTPHAWPRPWPHVVPPRTWPRTQPQGLPPAFGHLLPNGRPLTPPRIDGFTYRFDQRPAFPRHAFPYGAFPWPSL